MTTRCAPLVSLTDDQLLAAVKTLASDERGATARLVAALAEIDRRKLYLGEGFSSLFVYCTHALHLAEHAAYNRIEAARAVAQWPVILEHVIEGRVNLSTLRLLVPHLSNDNVTALLESAAYKSKRDVEQLVAALRPLPDVPERIRKLPANVASARGATERRDQHSVVPGDAAGAERNPTTLTERTAETAAHVTPARRPAGRVLPLSSDRFQIQCSITRECHDRLRRVQDLLRHVMPDGDLG